MGRTPPDQSEDDDRPGTGRFVLAVDDIEDVDEPGEAQGLAVGSEVHDVEALGYSLAAAEAVDALLLAYLLDGGEPDDDDGNT